MANQKSIKDAFDDGHLDLTHWAEGVITRLQKNFDTQNVWPMGYPGPYAGYRNTRSGRRHQRNEGSAMRKFYSSLSNAASGDTRKIEFLYNYYLQFVDMGVGTGVHYHYQPKKARYDELFEKWKEQGDRHSRPIVSMEFRHQLTRLAFILQSYWADSIEVGFITIFTEND